jgi:hypothetical protein
MLSEAKHLCLSLRRSCYWPTKKSEILRFAQNDNIEVACANPRSLLTPLIFHFLQYSVLVTFGHGYE